jgi:S1-C subfamily serine protease
MQTPPESPSYPPQQPQMAPRPQQGPSHLSLAFSNGKRFALLKERSFLRQDIPDLFPSTGDPAVAVVRENPNDPTVLGLTNCSRTNWTATMPDGTQRQIEPGKSIRLALGTIIAFGNQTQAQVQPLGAGAAFMAQNGRKMAIAGTALILIIVLMIALFKPSGGGGSAEETAMLAKAKQAVFYIEVREGNMIGSGSGFFIDDKGHALTNHHVTGDHKTVTIKFEGGQQGTATVLKTDPNLDVSLLQVDGQNGNPYLPIMRSTELKPGQPLWTIGYPLGQTISTTDSSVAKGIYSGMRDARTAFPDLQPAPPEGAQIIQTDAGINHGNSGGAMVNEKGEVAGISQLIMRNLPGHAEGTQAVTNLNFGIPLDEVRVRFLPGTACDNLSLKKGD